MQWIAVITQIIIIWYNEGDRRAYQGRLIAHTTSINISSSLALSFLLLGIIVYNVLRNERFNNLRLFRHKFYDLPNSIKPLFIKS